MHATASFNTVKNYCAVTNKSLRMLSQLHHRFRNTQPAGVSSRWQKLKQLPLPQRTKLMRRQALLEAKRNKRFGTNVPIREMVNLREIHTKTDEDILNMVGHVATAPLSLYDESEPTVDSPPEEHTWWRLWSRKVYRAKTNGAPLPYTTWGAYRASMYRRNAIRRHNAIYGRTGLPARKTLENVPRVHVQVEDDSSVNIQKRVRRKQPKRRGRRRPPVQTASIDSRADMGAQAVLKPASELVKSRLDMQRANSLFAALVKRTARRRENIQLTSK